MFQICDSTKTKTKTTRARTSRLWRGRHLADEADGLALLPAAGGLPEVVVDAHHRAVGQRELVGQHEARVALLLRRLSAFS